MNKQEPETIGQSCLRDRFDRVVGGPLIGMDSQTAEFIMCGLADAVHDPALSLPYKDGVYDRRLAFACAATTAGLFYFFVSDNLDARVVLEKQPEKIRTFVDDLKELEQKLKLPGLMPARIMGH